jgi:plastocyanin
VSLVAEGTRFLTASLTAPAGGVTIVLDNRDSGIAHDVKVFSGGANIGFTSPAAGPITQTLALGILAAGSYSFVCDVHPQAMHGVLTVGG